MDEVLVGLTLKPFASAPQLAEILGTTAEQVAPRVAEAVAAGDVADMGGSYGVVKAASARVDEHYADRYGAVRANADLEAALDRFEGVNRLLLDVVSDWQTQEVAGQRIANDHADEAYDQKVLARLDRIHGRVTEALAPIAEQDALVARFLSRLDAALARVDAGESDYVCGIEVESYHNIWFQLHEHLLRMFGRDREV